ncbi:MAG: hypothetical protein CL946_09170 [Ectothiorhodospiraceae bacterium]|nr:hypothetical protein [Ectothiorhodospiraceae bacterium]
MKKIITMTAVFAFSVVLFSLNASADGPGHPQDKILRPGVHMLLVGPYGGLNINMHSGYFAVYEGDILCCEFDEGDGIGPVFGVKGFVPIAGEFYLTPRIAYESRDGEFDAMPIVLPIRGIDNQIEMATFENTLDASLSALAIDVLGAYVLVPSVGLYVAAGPSLSLLMSPEYTKTETITAPPNVDYQSGTNTQVLFEGDLELTESIVFDLRFGLGAMIQVSDGIFVNPEVLYSLGLTNISTENDWKANAIQPTIGVMFAL